MTGIRVVRPGLRTTVEDLGRRGVAAWGVPPGGAFDSVSFAAANLLVGNPDGAAGLEWTLRGPELVADDDIAGALVGAEFGARLDGRPVEHGRVFRWRRGETLDSGFASGGARCWMAVSGGLEVARVLGSRSTDVASGFGGRDGRPPRAGDLLEAGPSRLAAAAAIHVDPFEVRHEPVVLRALRGPQLELFPQPFEAVFETTPFRVATDSDRTGVRLEPIAPLPSGGPAEIEPEGTTAGAVQLTGSGPIILGVDRPVTGGYPKPALVIEADLGFVARLLPGMAIRFRFVTFPEALGARTERLAGLDALR